MLTYYAYLAVAAVVLYVLVAGRERTLSLPLMYIAGTMFFLVPGMVTGSSLLTAVDESLYIYAVLAIVIAIVGFLFGYRLMAHRSGRRRRLVPARTVRVPLLALAALLVISVLAKAYLDPDTIIGRVYTGVRSTDTTVGRYFAIGASIPTALGCLAPWLWRNTRSNDWAARMLIGGLVVTALVSLSRTPIFYVLGGMCLQALWARRSYWASARQRIALVAICTVLFPIATFLAALIKGTNGVVEDALAGRGIDFGVAYDFAEKWQTEGAISDAYGNLLFIIDSYPTAHPYQPSLTLLTILTAPIPRSVFPWKPWSASYHATNQILGSGTYERTGTSLAPSTIGELWMNGGLAGVLIGSILLGCFGAWFERKCTLNRDSYRTAIFHMGMIVFFLIPRGDLLSTFVRGSIYIVFAVVAGAWLTRLYGGRDRVPQLDAMEMSRPLFARPWTAAS